MLSAGWPGGGGVLAGLAMACLAALAGGLALALLRQLRRCTRAEAAASASAAKFRAYFDTCPDGLLVVSRDTAAGGVGALRIQDANSAAERLLAASRAVLLGSDPAVQPALRAAPAILAGLRRVLDDAVPNAARGAPGTAPASCKQEVSSPDGPRTWHATFSLVGRAGTASVLCTLRDVTEQLRTEAQLRQAQKMEAVGQLVAGIAHDFNNVLQSVQGGLELLEDELGTEPGPQELLGIARGAARRGSVLAHRLLVVSRQQAPQPEHVAIPAVLREVHDLLRHTLGVHVAVHVEAAPDAWPVHVDRTQLETSLLNLGINARDAMPDGGRILLQARNAVLPADPDSLCPAGEYVELCVSDTGAGMDQATLRRVFEPFFTTKPVGKGSGLGLAMVLGFARGSGGDVRIDSAPGQGTAVRLLLPRAVGFAAPALPPQAEAPRGSGRILLADDEPHIRLTLKAFLAGAGFEVVEAAGGTEALRLLMADGAITALVADHAMPDMPGAALLAEAQRLRPGLPALIITGYDRIGTLADLPEPVEVLRKPFTRAQLAIGLAAALARADTAREGDVGPQNAAARLSGAGDKVVLLRAG